MPPRALQSGSDRRRVQAASSATVAPLRVATGKGCQPHAAAGSLIAVALLLYAPSAHAAASPPIPPAVERISAQPPSTIDLSLPAAPVGPSTRRGLEPSSPQIDSGLDLITHNSARTFGLTDYGIKTGNPANLIILPAESGFDAVRCQVPVRWSIRQGRVIATTQLAQTWIQTDSGGEEVSFTNNSPFAERKGA